ncbi:MAG: hypothetical protein LBT00_02215, partial [Spirochaetaceae bacterium]|nr:hypothetical protein [Spirochaetaceae bacterium]
MKKFVLLSLTVLLGVSLFLTGCGDPETGPAGPTGSSGQGTQGPGIIPGALSIAALQHQIDLYSEKGAELTFDNVTVTGGGVLDFKTVKAYIVGPLATDGNDTGGAAILHLENADITFAETGGNIALGHSGDFAIGKAKHFVGKGGTGTYAEKAESEADFGEVVGTVTAIQNYTLSDTATAIIDGLTVYVYGTLTVEEASVQPTQGKVIVPAAGTVALKGDNSVALANATFVDVNQAEIVITAETPAVAITLPDTVDGTGFSLTGENHVLTVNGATTKFVASVEGNGT